MSRGKATPDGWAVRRYRVGLPSKVWEWVTMQAAFIGCSESAFVGSMLLLQYQAAERDGVLTVAGDPAVHGLEESLHDMERSALEQAGFEF